MKVFIIILLLVGISLDGTVSLYWPNLLAGNKFLDDFVTFEILAVLSVAMTITFASVANIHLSVGASQAKIADKNARARLEKDFASPLRAETRSSAWLLFWTLVGMVGCLLVKGAFPDVPQVVSLIHGAGLLTLIINGVVLYDIYSTIFVLVEAGVEASAIDFSEEAPRAD